MFSIRHVHALLLHIVVPAEFDWIIFSLCACAKSMEFSRRSCNSDLMTCLSWKGQSRALSVVYIACIFLRSFCNFKYDRIRGLENKEHHCPQFVHVLKPPLQGHSKNTFMLYHLTQLWQPCLQTFVSLPMKNWPDLAILVCKMGSACTHPSDSKDAEFSVNEAEPGAKRLCFSWRISW